MNEPSGLGKTDRARLAALIRGTKGTISVAEASDILKVGAKDASKMLSRWAKKGWVSRVKRGLYITVPIESHTADVPLEDPWIVAERLFSPCYIGGWSAAEHWGLTEQIFRAILIMTTQSPRDRRPGFKGTSYVLRTVSPSAMFGLKTVWRGSIKVSVSDPSRTILDMVHIPKLGGGIRSVMDMLSAYMKSDHKDLSLIISYGEKLGNGAVFKRLGFILEHNYPEEKIAIEACRAMLTKGNARLDPSLETNRLIRRWHLWVPQRLVEGNRE